MHAKAYHWTVNPHQYPTTMMVTSVVSLDGAEQFVSTLEVGAFCGEECRGRDTAIYVPQLERYLLFLTVYGSDENDTIVFRLYDHALGEELSVQCLNNTLTYTENGIHGTLVEPYVIEFLSQNVTQTTSLNIGWTWWSSYIEQSDINGLDMLKEALGTNGLTIKSQNQFVNYNPNTGRWTGSLKSINNEGTFMIRVSTVCEVVLAGASVNPADHPITLNPGWTWIGYPVTATMSVAEAFANITPNVGDQVKSQSGFATYNGTRWNGSLKNMEPGKGYMYKSNSTGTVTLVYPDGVGE